MDRKVSKKDIGKLLGQWRQQFAVFVPSPANGASAMAEWDGEDTGFLAHYRNTVVSAKAQFFPPAEPMFGFQKDKEGYRIEMPAPDGRQQLVFGIRPCDARALSILDITFEDAYEDTYYLTRRKNTLLVGAVCTSPYDSCFCTSLGLGPAESKDVDLLLTDIGDSICDTVRDQPWTGYITRVESDEFIISAGTRVGLEPGDILEVFDSSRIIEGVGGQRFFSPGLKIGEIEIVDITGDRTKTRLVSGRGIMRGSTVQRK